MSGTIETPSGHDRIEAQTEDGTTIIQVDRSKPPECPYWSIGPLYPHLEMRGPTEFDIVSLVRWLHDEQASGHCPRGRAIAGYLRDRSLMASSLGLLELVAIQAKGIDFFRRYFADKEICGWKSTRRYNSSRKLVPVLSDNGHHVSLDWQNLDGLYGSRSVTLLFSPEQMAMVR